MSSRFHNELGVIHIANGKFSNEFFLKICRFVQWGRFGNVGNNNGWYVKTSLVLTENDEISH